jgi:hypothetical protein
MATNACHLHDLGRPAASPAGQVQGRGRSRKLPISCPPHPRRYGGVTDRRQTGVKDGASAPTGSAPPMDPSPRG